MELWIPKVERYLAAGYGTEDLSEMLGRLQPTMLDVLSPIDTRDKSEWRDLVDRCDRIAQVAQQIGCPSIQVVVLDNMGGMSLRQQRCFVAGRLKELADVTSSYGVVLAIEPVAFSPLRSLNDISELIEDVGLDKLKMVLDTWHLWAGGESWERVAEVDSSLIVTAHIGDSRIGLIRGEEYHQLTSDHSLVNALLKAGQLTPEEAETHPQKNIITQSIGQKDEIQPDFGMVSLEPGDYLLLNSDGLTNMISGSEIYDIVTSDISLEDKVATLIRFANNAGGLDNITVALVYMNEEAIE